MFVQQKASNNLGSTMRRINDGYGGSILAIAIVMAILNVIQPSSLLLPMLVIDAVVVTIIIALLLRLRF